MEPRDLLREGRLDEALKALQNQIRKNPADAKLRVFLFQLLCVVGDWDRALTQLNVATEMDPSHVVMGHVYRPALSCEALRAEIFAGSRSPLVFGEPDEWVGWMVQANAMGAEGHFEASQELRGRALDAAPATEGQINGQPFQWIADTDSRLGPLLEAIINGRYFWVPFTAIRQIVMEEPADLRDLVWLPAQFTWANGGTAFGLIPARYPGSEESDDPGIRLARKTEWVAREGELYLGLGQRVLATDEGDHPLLQIREITLGTGAADQGAENA